MDVNQLMVNVNSWVKDILKENYVGVYFHGSLRLGSFNPNMSDLDFLIVVNDKLDNETKEKICEVMLEHEKEFPHKGFEFSVLLKEYCKNIVHPMPYELHMSKDWIEIYITDKTQVINSNHKVDPDLVSHINVVNQKNEKLDFGCKSERIFSKVPQDLVVESNYLDIKECAENIIKNPIYSILNLCRFYAYIKDGLTLSKFAGGKYAIKENCFGYKNLIKSAMNDYLNDKHYDYKKEELEEFAQTAITLINNHLKKIKHL